jgi:2-polyprenyl-6-methoxyphenol hydroxylase-like FAD-dependent oxidoreductase
MTDPHETDVLIVGAGPVGLGLAIDLGQRGIRTTIVERYLEPQPIPKGQNLTQRTLEHFHFWGAERELRAARTIPKDYGIGGLTAYGTLLGDYAYSWMQRELVRPFYFTDNERLPQYATEAVLRRRAGELPQITTLYGWSAEQTASDGEGVRLTISERGGTGRRALRGKYLVGCDGSRSTVRSQAAITQTLSDHDRRMVLLVFRSLELHKLLERYPGKSFYAVLHPRLQGYWQFFGRVDLGTTWFFHAPVPPETTRDNFDFRALVYEAAGGEFDVAFEHVGFWDLRFAVADSYRSGRAFVAGDAAHSHPPYGGYGINLGLEDAANLGWKLAAAIKGWAGDRLLDSYDEERRPVFQSATRDFIEKSILADRDFLAAFDPAIDKAVFEREWGRRATGATSEVQSFEPNYAGSSIVFGPAGAVSSAAGKHEFIARAGHHLAPQRLSSGRDVFEEFGDGFTLLAFDADVVAIDAFRRAAELRQIPLKIVSDSRQDGRERYGAALILVRPDQYVAWAADGAVPGAETILARATGH